MQPFAIVQTCPWLAVLNIHSRAHTCRICETKRNILNLVTSFVANEFALGFSSIARNTVLLIVIITRKSTIIIPYFYRIRIAGLLRAFALQLNYVRP